ncbi:MAG: ABC transporter permease [Caulobacteraceae bacterium]
MFRNVLAATLRNLMRNRLYAAISIGGLAVGMAAAILTGLFVRDELTFDRFVPGYRSVYVLVSHFDTLGLKGYLSSIPAEMAAPFRLDFPQAKTVVRYGAENRALTRGGTEFNDIVGWVDPDFFVLFPFKTLAGELRTSVQTPDGAVFTRTMARKYFGADAPIGQTFLVDRKTRFRVKAVIDDLPDNSNFAAGIFLSGTAPMSPLIQRDGRQYKVSDWASFGRTYFRLDDPAQAADINRALPGFLDRRVFPASLRAASAFARGASLRAIPDADLHLLQDTGGPEVPSGDRNAIGAFCLIATLIVLIAAINFVNLMTARAGYRAVEVGVRKASGAARRHLIWQFIGESVLYALAAALAALMLAELALPGLNAMLGRRMTLDYWRDPTVLLFVAGLVLVVGVAAGVYPALVLSSFRPGEVLKGGAVKTAGSAIARHVLVGLQMAVLVSLLLGVLVIARQTHFAMTSAVGMDTDQVLQIRVYCSNKGDATPRAFVQRVAQLPGVAVAACSHAAAAGQSDQNTSILASDGRTMNTGVAPIDFGFFEVYGVKPLAGRLPSRAFSGADMSSALPGPQVTVPKNVVINAGLARALGYATPQDAVGKSVRLQSASMPPRFDPVTIVGVVPDTQFDLTKGPPKPLVYVVLPRWSSLLSVKVRAGRIPETVSAVDRLWKELGDPRPISRRFTNDFLNVVYAPTIRQGWLVGALGGVALFLSCLGLFGLAAFVAERRTKEIGVRKAMGASVRDILRLLLWSFAQPVLWAILVAWPLGWWAMDQWLKGFSARISLSPAYFLAAGGAAVVIAVVTVSFHAIRVARAKPALALRYE